MNNYKPYISLHNSRLSLCASHTKDIMRNGGGKNNPSNVWYILQIKNHCKELGIDILEIIDLDALTPQLPTADVPLAVATGNRTDITTANIPLLEIDQTPATVFNPPPIIQFSRANKCKLETCLNDADGRIYCSDKCRVKWNNTHNRKPSKKSA